MGQFDDIDEVAYKVANQVSPQKERVDTKVAQPRTVLIHSQPDIVHQEPLVVHQVQDLFGATSSPKKPLPPPRWLVREVTSRRQGAIRTANITSIFHEDDIYAGYPYYQSQGTTANHRSPDTRQYRMHFTQSDAAGDKDLMAGNRRRNPRAPPNPPPNPNINIRQNPPRRVRPVPGRGPAPQPVPPVPPAPPAPPQPVGPQPQPVPRQYQDVIHLQDLEDWADQDQQDLEDWADQDQQDLEDWADQDQQDLEDWADQDQEDLEDWADQDQQDLEDWVDQDQEDLEDWVDQDQQDLEDQADQDQQDLEDQADQDQGDQEDWADQDQEDQEDQQALIEAGDTLIEAEDMADKCHDHRQIPILLHHPQIHLHQIHRHTRIRLQTRILHNHQQ